MDMDTSLYETLEVSSRASDSEIKRAYHKLARQYHPDKNPGYEERFKEIQFAYEVLSDPQKREMYDRFGLDAVKNDGGSSGMPDDISEMFFGGGGPGGLFSHIFGGGEQRKARPKPIGVPLEVTLEELYNGTVKQVEYTRKVLCDACDGSGSKTGVNIKCRKCRGSGMVVSHRPIGPGMMQQIRAPCSDCRGTGDYIKDKDRCKKCEGKRVYDEKAKLDVPVIPGMEDEARIPFPGEGNQEPEVEAGDLIVVLQQKEHEVFQREGLDLFVNKDISLVEALCGLTFVVDHLDGQKLAVQKPPGEVIFPGCIKGLREKGMPKFRRNELKHWVSECRKGRHPTNFTPPDFYGNLYFKFNVVFPDNQFICDDDDVKALISLLPRKPVEPRTSDDDSLVSLMNYDDTRGVGGEEDRDHDDDMHDAGGGVRCAQQ